MLPLLASIRQWGRLLKFLPLFYSYLKKSYYEYKASKITQGVLDANAPMSDDDLIKLNSKLRKQREENFPE